MIRKLALLSVVLGSLSLAGCKTQKAEVEDGVPVATGETGPQGVNAVNAPTSPGTPDGQGGVTYGNENFPPPTPAHQRVMDKLNAGMLRIPEVAMKSHQMMSEIGKNGVTIVAQAVIFDKWLDEYAKSHPAEMAKAKAEQAKYGGLPDVKEGVILGPGGPEFGGGSGNVNGRAGAQGGGQPMRVPVGGQGQGQPMGQAPAQGQGSIMLMPQTKAPKSPTGF